MWQKLLSLNMLRGFQHKNFRYYFSGKLVSFTGHWIQRTALSWYIYNLTDSVAWLGIIGFVSQIPSFIITPFGGYFADRYERLKLLKISQTFCMIQAFTLATLILTGLATIWTIVVLSFLLGCVESFESPIRHSFVTSLVPDKSLVSNAIAINSAIFNGARFIGPTIAGFLISSLGEGYCFLINAFCYLAVLLALFKVKVQHTPNIISNSSVFGNIRDGIVYVYQHPSIFFFIINVAVFTTFGFSYLVLLPVIARDILQGNAKTLGYIMTMIGSGALSGAILLGSIKSTVGLGKLMVKFSFLACAALTVIAFSSNFYITAALAYVCGISLMMQTAGSNIVIQTLVEDSMRGRVLSIFSLSFLGFIPLGSLLAGTLSNQIGVRYTILICVSILFIACLALKKKKEEAL